MKISPEIEVHERVKEEKNQKELVLKKYFGTPRKNNRKNTRGRKTQYIKCVDDTVFPPRFYTKTIKHPNN